MCIALPLGPSDSNNQSKLWAFIRSTPLNMLLFSAALQVISLLFVHFVVKKYWPQIAFTQSLSYVFYCLFWLAPFISYAFVMNIYPRLCKQGNIEYLQYAVFNTLGNFNLVLFYISSIFFDHLLSTILSLQLLLLIYTFKPIWRIGFWAEKKQYLLVKTINYSSLIMALLLSLILTGYSFNIALLSFYIP